VLYMAIAAVAVVACSAEVGAGLRSDLARACMS
jgi:hypothetical protein